MSGSPRKPNVSAVFSAETSACTWLNLSLTDFVIELWQYIARQNTLRKSLHDFVPWRVVFEVYTARSFLQYCLLLVLYDSRILRWIKQKKLIYILHTHIYKHTYTHRVFLTLLSYLPSQTYVHGGSNMTGTDLCVNKSHCAAAVRPWESEATTSTLPPARVRTCSVLSGGC